MVLLEYYMNARPSLDTGPLFVQAHRHCVIASSSEIPLSTSIINMKDLLESLRKPNQWILSNVKDLSKCGLLQVTKSGTYYAVMNKLMIDMRWLVAAIFISLYFSEVSDLPESLRVLSLVDLDVILVGEGEKRTNEAREDSPEIFEQGKCNSNEHEHFEFETEWVIVTSFHEWHNWTEIWVDIYQFNQ